MAIKQTINDHKSEKNHLKIIIYNFHVFSEKKSLCNEEVVPK